jgi:uncharacterized membrane protein YoaK (UPF0700 family)
LKTGASGRLDHVFVANITGNIIFIGFAIVGAHGYPVTAPLVVIAGFFAGASTAGATAASPHPGTAMRDALVVGAVIGVVSRSRPTRGAH